MWNAVCTSVSSEGRGEIGHHDDTPLVSRKNRRFSVTLPNKLTNQTILNKLTKPSHSKPEAETAMIENVDMEYRDIHVPVKDRQVFGRE